MIMIEKTFPITEQLIESSLTLSEKLQDLLSQEATYLRSKPSAQKIAAVAASKKETVGKLEQLATHLKQVMATEKLTPSSADIEQYFQIAETAGISTRTILQQWHKMQQTAQHCRHLNEMNGASINLLAQHNRRALQILRGKTLQATTYGPDGATHSERFSNSVFSV
jgi:flagellar biosynthesis protein FlgN